MFSNQLITTANHAFPFITHQPITDVLQ